MDKSTVKGLTIGKNLVALGLVVLSLGVSAVGVKILMNDLSYISILELIKYITFGGAVMIAADGVKSIKIK